MAQNELAVILATSEFFYQFLTRENNFFGKNTFIFQKKKYAKNHIFKENIVLKNNPVIILLMVIRKPSCVDLRHVVYTKPSSFPIIT